MPVAMNSDSLSGCVLQVAEGSTVIDMTGPEPTLVRQGKGDPSLFVDEVLA